VLYPLSYGGGDDSQLTQPGQRSSAITFANASACGCCTMM
jgi:hypothetical protein